MVLQLLEAIPGIIAAIRAVEAAIPGSGQGKAKLDAVLDLVQAADKTLATYAPQIAEIVGVLVRLFNATGWTTK